LEARYVDAEPHGPWNPGLASDLSPELWALCTIFRPENAFVSYAEAAELRDLTGLALPQLVVFRPERLALHEILVRVIADYEIPDPEGSSVASLGINFRRMTHAILGRHVKPRINEIAACYEPIRASIDRIVRSELHLAFDRPPAAPASRSAFRWPARRKREKALPAEAHDDEHDRRMLGAWSSRAQSEDPTVASAYDALIRVVTAIESQHGRLWGDPTIVATLATGVACNVCAAREIGRLVAPMIAAGAAAEGFRPLPAQQRSIVLSTKGASASGKSTMRPLQRKLAERLGVRWNDFALISPDIFRRDLLDIDSLGPHYKYFGPFTSHETEVVDRKLDRYLGRKGGTPHMLVDRFRFDSFVPDSEEHRELLSRLDKLELVHYLFMITPPEETVERAWRRGLEIGRYKALDDLLAHNVEACVGMERLFLTRAPHSDKLNRHYEFLDNDVPRGEVPLTVAFGWNGELNVLDIKRMLDLDRYQKIDIGAREPGAVYPSAEDMAVERNCEFLAQCVKRFPVLRLADRATGRIYARVESGRLAWRDSDGCAAITDAETLRALRVVVPELLKRSDGEAAPAPEYLDPARFLTVGRWGGDAIIATSSASELPT
jgi:hypothetical protein